MNDTELADALDGLAAWDAGAHNSGIHDAALRARVKDEVKRRHAYNADEWRRWLARHVRNMFLTDEAIERGSGAEDALEFLRWMEDERLPL